MKQTTSLEWLRLIYLTLFGVIIFAGFYVLAAWFIPPAEDIRDYYAGVIHFRKDTDTRSEPTPLTEGRIPFENSLTLERNREIRLGSSIVVYRGLGGDGTFLLDLFIPTLDPDTPYPYRFSVSEARMGFNLADKRFQLVSARQDYLHLVRQESG